MVSLSKNQTVSLSKQSTALSQLQFGLGWDPVKKKYIEDGKTEVIDSQYIKQSFNSAFESGLEEALKLI